MIVSSPTVPDNKARGVMGFETFWLFCNEAPQPHVDVDIGVAVAVDSKLQFFACFSFLFFSFRFISLLQSTQMHLLSMSHLVNEEWDIKPVCRLQNIPLQYLQWCFFVLQENFSVQPE